jgi:nucleoside-diphosphate-sugar epimerase
MAKRKVLIAGATGYIASHLLPHFLPNPVATSRPVMASVPTAALMRL